MIFQANYVKTNGLGGYMVWAIDLDDINGQCGYGINPLKTKLKQLFSDGTVVTQPPTTAQPTQPPTTAQPTQAPTTAQSTQPTQPPSTAQPTQAPTSQSPTECGGL